MTQSTDLKALLAAKRSTLSSVMSVQNGPHFHFQKTPTLGTDFTDKRVGGELTKGDKRLLSAKSVANLGVFDSPKSTPERTDITDITREITDKRSGGFCPDDLNSIAQKSEPDHSETAKLAIDWLRQKGFIPSLRDGQVHLAAVDGGAIPDTVLARVAAIESDIIPLLTIAAQTRKADRQRFKNTTPWDSLEQAQRVANERNRAAASRGETNRYCRCGWLAQSAWMVDGRETWVCDECREGGSPTVTYRTSGNSAAKLESEK